MTSNQRPRVYIAGTAPACSGLPFRVVAALVACLVLPVNAAFAQTAAGKPGIVSHLLVLSDKSEDVSSPEAWAKTYIKPGMSDQEKALAIWKTVVRYRHQTNATNEFLSPEINVHDPLKTIHVYGVGICCCASSNVCGLARYLGMRARGRAVNVHMISEVFYGGGWHMIDGSLMNYFFMPDGTLAPADEIHKAVVQWHEKNPGYRGDSGKLAQFAAGGNWRKAGPPLLATCPVFLDSGFNPAGVHGWHATMGEYDYKNAPEYEYWSSMGYQLNVQLREGEKLTRNWSNKGKLIDWVDADILEGGKNILGLQRQLGDKAPGRIGNGVLEYHVPLASGGFRGGALVAENLASTSEDGAAPAVHVKDSAQPGVLVLRMPTSYVYVSGTLAFKAVVGNGGSVAVSFSDNQGMDWKRVADVKASGEQKIDLTLAVFRRYDYRLKFELTGKGTGLDSLDITHDVQHSQAPLPTLTEGKNTITLAAGPQEGTITLEGNTDPAAAPWKQLSIKDFHPALNNAELRWARPHGKGDVTFKIPTPGDITRVRMNLGYRLRDANDSYTILVSFDDGKTFKQAGRVTGPTAGYTKYLTFSDVPSRARTALVKLEGKEVNTVCLFGLRIDVDYKEPRGGFRPVKITYLWEENGQPKSDVHVAVQPQETYEIACGPKTVVKSFSLELADLRSQPPAEVSERQKQDAEIDRRRKVHSTRATPEPRVTIENQKLRLDFDPRTSGTDYNYIWIRRPDTNHWERVHNFGVDVASFNSVDQRETNCIGINLSLQRVGRTMKVTYPSPLVQYRQFDDRIGTPALVRKYPDFKADETRHLVHADASVEFHYEIDPQRPSYVVSGRVLQGRISSIVYIVDALWTDNHFLPTHELVEGQPAFDCAQPEAKKACAQVPMEKARYAIFYRRDGQGLPFALVRLRPDRARVCNYFDNWKCLYDFHTSELNQQFVADDPPVTGANDTGYITSPRGDGTLPAVRVVFFPELGWGQGGQGDELRKKIEESLRRDYQ